MMYNFILKLSEEFEEKTEFWGKKASGLLFFCKEDNTILLLKRSPKSSTPNVWGIPGGAIYELGDGWHSGDHGTPDPDDQVFLDSAIREAEEELGLKFKVKKTLPSSDYSKGSFTYRTYIVPVSKESKDNMSDDISLNWEHTDWEWFNINKLPANIHPGIKYTLSKSDINSADGPQKPYISPGDRSSYNYGYLDTPSMMYINQNEI